MLLQGNQRGKKANVFVEKKTSVQVFEVPRHVKIKIKKQDFLQLVEITEQNLAKLISRIIQKYQLLVTLL